MKSLSSLSLPGVARVAMAGGLIGTALLGGCSSTSDSLVSSKIDYRSAAAAPSQNLQVPPDLTQLNTDPRYQAPAGGSVSATSLQNSGESSAAPVATQPTTALSRIGDDLRIERSGSQRWLVTRQTPEQVWPVLQAFWQDNGFPLTVDTPQVGVMETDWAENRAKLPDDMVGRAIGKVLDRLRDTGERDRFRTRVERNGNVTEITINHRGIAEVQVGRTREDGTRWQPRPSDPTLEAEMLARLMLRLSGQDDSGKQPSAAALESATRTIDNAPSAPQRARIVPNAAGATLQIDDTLERSWRRVGLALDRSGFTVEERNRTQGSYVVRYVDPKLAGKAEPGFFSRVFGGEKKEDLTGTRYRLKVVADGGSTSTLSVLTEADQPAKDEGASNIVQMLASELR
jgi:outer membrane protein assembly factor BamC